MHRAVYMTTWIIWKIHQSDNDRFIVVHVKFLEQGSRFFPPFPCVECSSLGVAIQLISPGPLYSSWLHQLPCFSSAHQSAVFKSPVLQTLITRLLCPQTLRPARAFDRVLFPCGFDQLACLLLITLTYSFSLTWTNWYLKDVIYTLDTWSGSLPCGWSCNLSNPSWQAISGYALVPKHTMAKPVSVSLMNYL